MSRSDIDLRADLALLEAVFLLAAMIARDRRHDAEFGNGWFLRLLGRMAERSQRRRVEALFRAWARNRIEAGCTLPDGVAALGVDAASSHVARAVVEEELPGIVAAWERKFAEGADMLDEYKGMAAAWERRFVAAWERWIAAAWERWIAAAWERRFKAEA